MRFHKVLFIAIAVASVAMFIVGASLHRDADPVRAEGGRLTKSPLPSPSLIPAPDKAPSITKAELLAKLRQLSQKFDVALYEELKAHGPSIQRMLAEILVDDAAVAHLAAGLLRDVATREALPFVRGAIAAGLPDDVTETLVDLLVRLKDAESVSVVAALLDRSESLQRKALEYLGTVPTAESGSTLHQFLMTSSSRDLLRAAAEALAAHDTREAGRILLEVWAARFEATDPLLLEALVRMADAPDLILAAMRAQADPSRKNVLISLAAAIGGEFAMKLVNEILAGETHPQVRRQAILVLGALGTAEAQAKLLALLSTSDFAAAANALLTQTDLRVDRAALAKLFASGSDLVRSVAAVLLARDTAALAEDPKLLDRVLAHAREGLASADPLLRHYALTAIASLAPYEPSAAESLPILYSEMTTGERELSPHVYQALVQTGRADLPATLADEEAPVFNRMLAAQSLFETGNDAALTETLKTTQSPELCAYLAGMKVARDGNVDGLRALHAEEKNSEKRKFYETQIDIWSRIDRKP